MVRSTPPDPSAVRLPGPWVHHDVSANGLRFHTVEPLESQGDFRRTLVLLLHGFGDFWWSWRHQLMPLAAAGVRPVAVDLRGYGGSDKPPRGYDAYTLASDVSGLVRVLGHRSAVVMGHAEGGLIAWAAAALHPREILAIVTLAAPHPIELRRSLLSNASQIAAALPTLLHHQIPHLPERYLRHNNGDGIARVLHHRAGTAWKNTPDFAETEQLLRMAIQIPPCAHVALEYQRWAFRSQFRPDGHRFLRDMRTVLPLPGLLLRGADDPYVLSRPIARSTQWLSQARYETIVGAGHYAHQENPTAVNEQLKAFLAHSAMSSS